MPIYIHAGKTYNIPDDKAERFEASHPDAEVTIYGGGKKYKIPTAKQAAFKQRFGDWSYSESAAAQQTPQPQAKEKPQETQAQATQPAQAAQATPQTQAAQAQGVQATQTAAAETPWTAEMMALARQLHLKETGEDPITYMPRGYRTGKTGSDDELLAAWYNEAEDTRKQLWDKQAELDVTDYKADRDAVYAEQGKWDPGKAKQWREKMMATYRIDPMQEIPEVYRATLEQKWGKTGSDEAVLAAWLNEKENIRQGQWNDQMQTQKQKYMDKMKYMTSVYPGEEQRRELTKQWEAGNLGGSSAAGRSIAYKQLQQHNEAATQWIEADKKKWTPETAKAFRKEVQDETWYDPYSEVPESYKEAATKQWGRKGSEDAYFSAWMNMTNQERLAYLHAEQIKQLTEGENKQRMQTIYERAKSRGNEAGKQMHETFFEGAWSPEQAQGAGHAFAAWQAQQPTTHTLKAIEKANEIIEAYRNHQADENFFVGAFKGMKDGLSDIDNWTGVYMAGEMQDLYAIADKMKKGEALTQDEEDFLDAQAYRLAVEASLAEDLGWGYKSGNVTGTSIPFMLQMLASPVSVGAGGTVQSINKGFAAVGKRAIKKFGKTILRRTLAMPKGLEMAGKAFNIAGKAAKPLSKIVGKVADTRAGQLALKGLKATALATEAGVAQAFLFNSDKMVADAMERHLGNEMTAERANEQYGTNLIAKEGEEWLTAINKAVLSQTAEQASEYLGTTLFEPIGKMITRSGAGREISDLLSDISATTLMRAAKNSRAGAALRLMSQVKGSKVLDEIMGKAQWNGLFGEHLEELANGLVSVAIGDIEAEEFASAKHQAETVLGLAWTSGALGVLRGGQRVKMYAKAHRMLADTDRTAQRFFTHEDGTISQEMMQKWEEFKASLEGKDLEGMRAELSRVMDDIQALAPTQGGMNIHRMRLLMDYMKGYAYLMGISSADNADEQELTAEQEQAETALAEGMTADTALAQLDIVQALAESEKRLGEMLGTEDVDSWLDAMGETAEAQLEALHNDTTLPDETKQAAEQYLNDRLRYEGVRTMAEEEVENRVNSAMAEFDQNTNKDTGKLTEVKMKDESIAYVVGGSLEAGGNIYIRYADGRLVHTVASDVVEVLSDQQAQPVRDMMAEGVRQQAVAEIAARMQAEQQRRQAEATRHSIPADETVPTEDVAAPVEAEATEEAAPREDADYEAMTPEEAVDDLWARTQEDEEVMDGSIQDTIEQMQQRLAEAEAAPIVAGSNMTERIANRQAHNAAVAQAKASLEHWQKIAAMAEQRKAERAAQTQAAEELKQQLERQRLQEEHQRLQEEQTRIEREQKAAEQKAHAEEVQANMEQYIAEAEAHNSKHDVREISRQTGVKAKRIKRILDWAAEHGVKIDFADYTTTGEHGQGQMTNASIYSGSRRILLNKGVLSDGTAIEFIAGHELTHQAKADGNMEAWENLRKATIEAMGQERYDSEFERTKRLYRQAYRNMSEQELNAAIEEEVVADWSGMIFLDPEAIDKMRNVPKTFAQKVHTWLKNLFYGDTAKQVKDAISAWQQLAEGKELTEEADEREAEQDVKHSIPTQEPIGRSLTADEAEILITDMKENADIAPELEFSIENWLSEFGKDGLVTTPIGKVKMGENQIAKLLNKNREKRFGLIRPTLQTPDVIIEKHAPAEGAERESKFLFIKTFVKPDGSRFIHFESVTVLKDGMDVSISSHEIGDKALRKEMQNGIILHLNSKLSSGSDKYLTKTPTERPDLVPAPDNRFNISPSLGGGVSPISHADDAAPAISLQSRNDDELSASKDTQSVSTEQTDKEEISEKSAESNVDVTNEEVASLPKNEGEQALFSISTYEQQGREILEAYVMDQVSKGRLTQEQADDIISEMEDIYNICVGLKDKYTPFGNWSEAEVIVDEQGKPVFSVIKANGDYAMNLDFSLVCKKRRTLDAVLREMIDRGIINNYELGQVDMAKINDIIRQHGFETACRLCFVDAKRFRVAQVADVFCEMYNALVDKSDAQLKKISKKEGNSVPGKIARMLIEHPENRVKLSRENFMDSKGFEDMTVNKEAIMKLYNAKKGTGGPKASYGDTQYLNDILGKQWSAEAAYEVGGVRLQSFSDYVPRMVFDYIQMVADLSAKGLPVHAYTKEPTFAKQFGLTGIKINLSLVPRVEADGIVPGLDANGEYVWQEGETFPYEEAIAIQNAEGYRENCGTIAVGVSDAHIEKMLSDDNIRMVIPYHKSGLNPLVAKHNNIDQFQDYTNEQNTRNADGTKLSKAQMKNHFNFNADLHKHGNPKLAAQNYLDWCDKMGYLPKFDQFREHPNYYKLLEDFTTCITENGVDTFVPQGAVTMTFPNEESAFGSIAELIEEGLEEDAVLEGNRQADLQNIVDDIEKEFDERKFSIPVYHGSGAAFDKFDHAFMGSGEGMQSFGWGTYVSEVEGIAKTYAETMRKNATSEKHRENAVINSLATNTLQSFNNDRTQALKYLRSLLDEKWSDKKRVRGQIKIIETGRFLPETKAKAHLYTVDIPDDNGSNYIGYNEKLSEGVKEKIIAGYVRFIKDDVEDIREAMKAPETYSDEYVLQVQAEADLDINDKGKFVYAALSRIMGSDELASKFLNQECGIVGIKYPAQATTGGRKDNAQNYVIFNESDAQIVDHRKFSITPDILAANERFNEELDEFKAKTHKGLLHLGKPGAILRTIGVDADEMTLSPSVLSRHLKKHNLTADDLIGLPLSVQTPILAYRHGDKNPNLVVVTEMDVKGGKLSVSLELDENGHVVEIDNIRSVHSKDATKEMARLGAMREGELEKALRWVEKEEVQDWLGIADLNRPIHTINPELSSVANVLLSFQNPPIIEDESSQNVENAKSGEQKYSLAPISGRGVNESFIAYANRVAREVERLRNWQRMGLNRVLARDQYEQRVASGWYQTQEALQDSMLGLKALMESIAGKGIHIEDIPDFENPYLGENRLSSVNQAESEIFARMFIKPMLEEISKLARNEQEREILTNYAMAKHGLERNQMMATRDAQRAFADPNNTETLLDLFNKFRKRDYAGLTGLTGKKTVAAAEKEAQQMVDDYEQAHNTDELWKKIDAVNDAILLKQKECGLLGEKMYKEIRAMYDYYIPLRGFDEETIVDAYAYLDNRAMGEGSVMQRAQGRTSKADNPWAYLQSMADQTIMQGNRNKLVKEKLLTFVTNHPSDAVSLSRVWMQYDPSTRSWEVMMPKFQRSATSEEVAAAWEELDREVSELAEQHPDLYKTGKETLNLPFKVPDEKMLKEHQVLVRTGAGLHIITINGSPRAAQAVNGQTNPDKPSGAIGSLVGALEKLNRFMSQMYTSNNPDFIYSNWIRDSIYGNSMMWVKESPAYARRFNANWAKYNPNAVRRLLIKYKEGTLDMNNYTEALFNDFMMNGGETGYSIVHDIEAHKTAIKKEMLKLSGDGGTREAIGALLEKMEDISRAVENATRFAAFVTSMEEGRGIGRSVWDAKEVSVNFNKKGAGDKFWKANGQTKTGNAAAFMSGFGRMAYIFWNAALQGTTNTGRQVKRHPVKALSALAVSLALGYLTALAGTWDGDDDEEKTGEKELGYLDLPEYTRRSNMVIKTAGGHWLTIPLPIEYRALYGLGELAGVLMSGKQEMSGGDIGMAVAQQLAQVMPVDMLSGNNGWLPFVPSAGSPLAQVLSNNKWTGQSLWYEPEDKTRAEMMPEWAKAYKGTDRYLVAMTKALSDISGGDDVQGGMLDLNPVAIETLLDGHFGAISTMSKNLVKSIEMAAGVREYDPRYIPIWRRMVVAENEQTQNYSVNADYGELKETYDEMLLKKRDYQKKIDDGREDYEEKLEKLEGSDDGLVYDIFEEYKDDIKDCTDDLREAEKEGDEEEIEEAKAALQELKRMIVEEVRAARKKKSEEKEKEKEESE